eukprot:1660195-Prymnesium_polylepis.1
MAGDHSPPDADSALPRRRRARSLRPRAPPTTTCSTPSMWPLATRRVRLQGESTNRAPPCWRIPSPGQRALARWRRPM